MFKLPNLSLIASFPSPVKFQKGFSLIEIILVIMIVGFIVSLINTLPSSLGLISYSKHESVAKEISQKQIEDLRALGYDRLSNTNSPPPAITDSKLSKIPQGTGSYSITDCSSPICNNNEEIKTVSVVVSWVETGNKKRQVKIDTLVAKGGLQ